MTLVEKINEGIKDSMKSKNLLRLETLRMLKSKILAADARGNLQDSEVIKLFKTYLGNLQEACEQAQEINRIEAADKLKKEIEIVQEFLPQKLSLEETRKFVEQAIVESGAKSKKDLSLVMRILKQNSALDGKLAKEITDQLLTD